MKTKMSICLFPTLQFVAFGDWGTKTDSFYQLMKILHKRASYLDFCILLGDNFYPNGIGSLDDPRWKSNVIDFFPSYLRLYPILGNHDWHQNPLSQIYFTYVSQNRVWKMPFFYYDEIFTIGTETIHFLFLDTCLMSPNFTEYYLQVCNVSKEQIAFFYAFVKEYKEKQMQWLQNTLQNSKSKYKIVCGHYPILSNGAHNVSPELYHTLIPIFEKYSVNLYLCGHDHNAQVIQYGNIYCVLSGASSHSIPIKPIVPQTLFYSSNCGFFQFQINTQSIQIDYINLQNKVEFSLVI